MNPRQPPRGTSRAALAGRVGDRLGPSRPLLVDQAMVDGFAATTGDRQWIHVDQVRAASGPFGGTIAHGYLTLALIPVLLEQLLPTRGPGMTINYGLNRVRFPSPVRVGSWLRLEATVAAVEPLDGGGVQAVLDCVVTVDAQPKPACVAESVLRWYPAAG